MRMRNKILCFALSLCILLSFLPLNAFAASAFDINAEDVITGGQNVGYYDSSESGTLETPWTSDRQYMVVMRAGEWQKYKVKIDNAGNYELVVLLGKGEGGNVSMTALNETTGQTVEGIVGNTGSYIEDMEEFTLGEMTLKAGDNIIKLTLPADALYLERISLVPVVEKGSTIDFSKNEGAYRTTYIPAIVEAEDYDVGLSGSLSADGKNNGKAYRKDEAMDIYETEKNSGKYYLELTDGEFVNYTVMSEYSAVYDVYANLLAIGGISIYIDGNSTPVKAEAPVKAGKTFAASVYLEKGTHVFKVVPNGTVQLDSLSIESSKNTENVFDPQQNYVVEEKETPEVKNEVYKEFYVSLSGSDSADGSKSAPFATIERAQQAVREVNKNMTGDIYIYIEPGYYKLSETLQFTPEDGGKDNFNVIYKGATPFSETILGGGNLITGWEKTENELYKAYYDSPNDFRNLYINDVPAVRAMSKYQYMPTSYFKNEGSEYSYDGMIFSKKNFPDSFSDASRTEAVWTIEWMNYRMPVKSAEYTETEVRLEMEQPYFANIADSYNTSPVKKGAPLYFENDMTFLDEPGEFYYDMPNKTVYYFPREGEVLENVYACDTEYLINAQGTKDNNIKNLHFERLSFKYGAWYAVNDGISTGQADTLTTENGSIPQPAQLEFKHITGLKIKDCKFIGLGSSAVGITDGVTFSEIKGNLFKDISGSALQVGSHQHVSEMPEGQVRVSDIKITNNVIRRAAREYRSSCGIILYYVKNVDVSHNDLEEIPYSGISIGWGWGKDVKETGGHTISYNRIVDVLGPTHDGAHIYTLSPIRNTHIFRNYLEKTHDWRGGLYFDEGSGKMTAYENVVTGSANWLYARAGARMNDLKVYNNWSDTDVATVDEMNVTTYGNKVEKDGANGKWSAEAQAVIDAAGVEAPYKRLLSEAELPNYAKGYVRDLPKGLYSARNDWISPGTYTDFHDIDSTSPMVYSNGDIGNTVEGEWCEYEIEIRESGIFKFYIQAGNGDAKQEPKVKLYIDGNVANEGIPVPMWETNKWTTGEIEGGEYFLDKGKHTVRIEHADGNFMFGPFKFAKGEALTGSDPEYDEGKLPSEMKAEENVVFEDLRGHWSYDNVMALYDGGFIKGVSETEFAPDRAITLYETVLLAMRTSGCDENLWQEKLTELGMADYIADANEPVSREKFCDVIMKFYLELKGPYSVTVDYNAYNDFDSISAEFILCVWGAKALNLMKGDTNGNFNPQNTLTRGEAATVINRYHLMIK